MLELNQSQLWYVNKIGEIEVVDEEGFFTGELETVFSKPTPIDLHLYPANGKVLESTFGLNSQVDFVTGSNVRLEPNTLLFYESPLITNMITYSKINNLNWELLGEDTWGYLLEDIEDNYEDIYDFKIDRILKSLNIYQYGLKGRR